MKTKKYLRVKYLRVTMPDGSRWDVPVEIIAAHRAARYSPDKSAPLYAHELAYGMQDDDEILQWAPYNMDWPGVRDHACRAQDPTLPAPKLGWVYGYREVVEVAVANETIALANETISLSSKGDLMR